MHRFTDKGVKALEPREKAYDLREGDGFGVRVLPSGTKSWFFLYHFNGIKKRLSLGIYPDVSLKQAREKHDAAKKLLAAGIDPGAVRDEEHAAPSVKRLVEEYLERWAKPRKRSWEEDQRQLERDVVPRWGSRKAASITRRDVRELIEEKAKGAPVGANRLLAVVRRAFNWAVEQDILETSPAFRVKAPAKENRKDRVLSPDEIRAAWSAWDRAGATPEVRKALRLILATAQRPGEVAGAHWSEFDLTEGVWTIPAGRAKNNQAHRVPLSPLARRIIGEPGSGYLFPSYTDEGPMNPLALTRACYRHARMTPLPVKSKSRGIRKRHVGPVVWKVEPFTPHDLRRTAASCMTGIGVPRLTVGKILNHVERGVTAIYDRHSYDLEKREALDRWGAHMEKIITGEKGVVVPLRRAKA